MMPANRPLHPTAAAFRPFIWRRDLLAMIIAHATIDVWALAISPSFSSWW